VGENYEIIMTETRAVLFDMDGVLASVSTSYREAIIRTCAHFDVKITQDDILAEKKKGNSNNDWVLSKRLIENRLNKENEITLENVTQVFEEIYQGKLGVPGLCETETLITPKGLLAEIHKRCHGKVAVVTGRPRKDCIKFLRTHNLDDIFSIFICMEDAPPKPNPKPVLLAIEALGVAPGQALMIGDTPDDIRAAVSAGVVGWGVLTPEEDAKLTLGLINSSQGMTESLLGAGAAGVMRAGLSEMLNILPLSAPLISSIQLTNTVKVS